MLKLFVLVFLKSHCVAGIYLPVESSEHLFAERSFVSEHIAVAVRACADYLPVLGENGIVSGYIQHLAPAEVGKSRNIDCELSGHKGLRCLVPDIYAHIYEFALALVLVYDIRIVRISRVIVLTPCN